MCPICELESRLSVIPGRRSTMRRGPEEVVTVIAVGRATTSNFSGFLKYGSQKIIQLLYLRVFHEINQ